MAKNTDQQPDLPGSLLTLKKTDLPGAYVSIKAMEDIRWYAGTYDQAVFWRGGITNLLTGENILLSGSDPQRLEPFISALRYEGKVFRALTIRDEAGPETKMIFLAEDKTLVFSDYHETECEDPAEWLAGWLFDQTAYSRYSKNDSLRIKIFGCRKEDGETVHGYRIDRRTILYDQLPYNCCENACFVFTDAVMGGFFTEGLCPALNGPASVKGTKLGYMDLSGVWAIPPAYLAGLPFHRGIARVMHAEPDESGWDRIGVIDYTGKGSFTLDDFLLYRLRPWEIIAMDRTRKYFLLSNRLVWGTEENHIGGTGPSSVYGSASLIDCIRPPADGKMLIATAPRPYTSYVFYPHEAMEEGYHTGYINFLDEPAENPDSAAIPVQYDYSRDFHEGVALIREWNEWGLISHSGTKIASGWDGLSVCRKGIVIGRNNRLFGAPQWYRADIRPDQDEPLAFSRISEADARAYRRKTIDSDETELTPPWIPFPDSDVNWDCDEGRPASLRMFRRDEKETDQYFADGYYTILREGEYSVFHTSDDSLLTYLSWKNLWFESSMANREPLIGQMTETGWNLFYQGVLGVYDGKKWGLINESGKMILSHEWDLLFLYEKIIVAWVSPGHFVVCDYSGRIICDGEWKDYKYDGISDYLAFTDGDRLSVLDVRTGEITRTDYPGLLTVREGSGEHLTAAFSAVHQDMLAVYDEKESFTVFIDPKGRKIPLDSVPEPVNPSAPIRAEWAGRNGPWYLCAEEENAVWIVAREN